MKSTRYLVVCDSASILCFELLHGELIGLYYCKEIREIGRGGES